MTKLKITEQGNPKDTETKNKAKPTDYSTEALLESILESLRVQKS